MTTVFRNGGIFDGRRHRAETALVIDGGRVCGVVSEREVGDVGADEVVDLAELVGAPARRVVLAADVVELAGAVPRKSWAALHVDTDDDADPDDDLAWYATQEIPGLIERLLAGR